MSLTKIVCTMGPAVEDDEKIRHLLDAGMTVARLNFSHGSSADKKNSVERLRRVAGEEGRFLAIMGDLQGPKIRVGKMPENGLELIQGAEIEISAEIEEYRDADGAAPAAGERESKKEKGPSKNTGLSAIPFPHPEIVESMHEGAHLLLDDGSMELIVLDVKESRIRAKVITGGVLTSHKGVNLPGVSLDISALTDKDKEDAELAMELGLDYLALSFVRSRDDIEELRTLLEEKENREVPLHEAKDRLPGENPHKFPSLVAKIEKPEALEDLEGIITSSDAVMVARGDLGVEIRPEQVPMAQKKIIRMCNEIGKPVITATQMLQSMIDNPRPTRAEASDVANAILDGSDAVMLSGETSVGSYPVEATAIMEKIARQMEEDPTFPYNQLMGVEETWEKSPEDVRISEAVSRVTVDIADECSATAIVTSTESGRTARTVARHRPRTPIVVITPFEETARRMGLIWGTRPVVVEPFETTERMIEQMVRACADAGLVGIDDNLILTAGIPFEVHGVTNMLKVHTVRQEELP